MLFVYGDVGRHAVSLPKSMMYYGNRWWFAGDHSTEASLVCVSWRVYILTLGLSFLSSDARCHHHLALAAPAVDEQKLYLINLGGYSANQFGELHRYHLVVATNTTSKLNRLRSSWFHQSGVNHILTVLLRWMIVSQSIMLQGVMCI